jgi:pyruvate formate lyase activating enzyme
MNIGALQRFSLIDYPGKICATVFTQGCNFRCPYCYNRELVDASSFRNPIDENKVFSFLEKRKGKLDAVTITGGEPTLQPDLIPFIERLREMKYLVKIDSNGSCPEVLDTLLRLRLVDYIAMDVKGPIEKYAKITGMKLNPEKIRQSIHLIMSSGIDYEFRTTVVRSLLRLEDLLEIGNLIRNAELYALQKFIPSEPLDPEFKKEAAYSDDAIGPMSDEIRSLVKQLILR